MFGIRVAGVSIARRAGLGKAECPRAARLQRDLVRLLRRAAAPASGPRAARLGPGPADLHLVVRVVAARDRAHGTNPLVTPRDLGARAAINLAWTTSVPGARGRVRAADRCCSGRSSRTTSPRVLLPALAAWTAFLLCRHLTGSIWAVARRRLPVRLLELHARPAAAGPPAHDRRSSCSRWSRSSLVRFVEGELDRRGLAWRLGVAARAPALDLDRGRAHADARARGSGSRSRSGGCATRAPAVARRSRPLAGGVRPRAAARGAAARLRAARPSGPLVHARPRQDGRDAVNLVFPTEVNGLGGAPRLADARLQHRPRRRSTSGCRRCSIVALFAWRERRRAGAQVLLAALVLALARRARHRSSRRRPRAVHAALDARPPRPGLENARLPRLAVYASPRGRDRSSRSGRRRRTGGSTRGRSCCRCSPSRPSCRRVDSRCTSTTSSARRSSPTASTGRASARREPRGLPVRPWRRLDALAGRERLPLPARGRLPLPARLERAGR